MAERLSLSGGDGQTLLNEELAKIDMEEIHNHTSSEEMSNITDKYLEKRKLENGNSNN